MSTSLATEPTSTPTDDGHDELDHLYCCDANRSLCGDDLTGAAFCESAPESLCVVCGDLDGRPCGEPDCPLLDP